MSVLTQPKVHLWTREEYARLTAAGLFLHQRAELIAGQVLETSPMGTQHATAVALVEEALKSAFGSGYFVRCQMPFAIGLLSEPEPDLAVVAGQIRDYAQAHPTAAALIVEVSDSSLTYDQTTKAQLYAQAGVPEYWIVNLLARHLEVFRQPMSDPHLPGGFQYASRQIVAAGSAIAPLAAPGALIRISDLLP